MASNDDNSDEPELVDLLYDDELDEQTAGRLRSRIQGSSPEDAAELEAYEQMLDRVRETETEEEVPSSLHDSIVDTAREHATRRTEETAHPEDRPPSPSEQPRSRTLWGRLSSGATLTQVGTAAAALLACGTILYVTRGELTAPSAPSGESAAKSSPAASTEQAAKSPSETSDMPEPPDETSESGTSKPEGTSAPSTSDEASRNALEMIRGDKSDESTASDQVSSETKSSDDSRIRRRQPPPPESNDEPSSAPKSPENQQAKKRAALDDAPDPESGQSKDDSAEMIDPFGSGKGAGSAKTEDSDEDAPTVASKSESASPTGKGDKSGPKAGEGDASADNPLVDVESSYLNDNWAETIDSADRLLASGDLGPADEARALELKARALEKQDKPGEARSVFSTLAERFPDYKSSVVESAIERTKQDRRDEPAASGDTNNDSSLNIFRGD